MTVTVNVSPTLPGLNAVVAAMHAFLWKVPGTAPPFSIPITTESATTVLVAAT